jgi:hypothetical protein
LDLSPIIEDVHAFGDQLPAPFIEIDAHGVDIPPDSSMSSYGELLQDRVSPKLDFFSLPPFVYFIQTKLINLPQTTDYFGLSDYLGDLCLHDHGEKSQPETVEDRIKQGWQGSIHFSE